MASIDPLHGSGLSPEAALLLATAGGPAMDDTIRALAAQVLDWTRFLQHAAQERAESVVAARLSALGVKLPSAIDKELKVTALRSDLRMARLTQRLEETIAAYRAAGVPLLLLKGAALGRTVYGFVPRRPMLDIDVLIPADRAREAMDVALATGWATTELEQLQEFYREHQHLPPLTDRRTAQFNFELHTAILAQGHPFAWEVSELLADAQQLGDGETMVPSYSDMLLHNALHFAWSHTMRFGPWRTFRDIDALRDKVDWEAFVAVCRRRRAASAAYWTLHLARIYAGVAVPPEVEQALEPRLLPGSRDPLARHFAQLWFPTDLGCPSRRLELTLWRMAIQPGRSGHGVARPWSRDQLLIDRLHEPKESVPRKFVRHLATGGRYGRYLVRIALGRT